MTALDTISKRNKTWPTVNVGDLVFIADKNRPRSTWPMARIVETRCGDDNVLRVVRVRFADGAERFRAIQHILPLELSVMSDSAETIDIDDDYNDDVNNGNQAVNDNSSVVNLNTDKSDIFVDTNTRDSHPPLVNANSESKLKTRYGRAIKRPSRLDI